MSGPVQAWQSWFAFSTQAVRLAVEAQQVIALRLMRMAAGGARGDAEARRMVTEKVTAAAQAQMAGATALLTGADNVGAAHKMMGVYKKRVGKNKRRLKR